MNRKLFSVVGLIILSILLVGTGIWVGRVYASNTTGQFGSMMGNRGAINSQYGNMMNGQYGNMMNGQYGNMMNGQYGNMMNGQYGNMMNGQYSSMMNGQYSSMMNGQVGNMMNGQVGNMMGGTDMMAMMAGFSGLSDAAPLTIAETETAVTNYLATLNNDNLSLGEIMIFSNHAYAQILDEGSGTGAFEVLVDPISKNVFPEPGPNMMWNTQYGMMSGNGNGGMMGNSGYAPNTAINITAEKAVSIAQEYLDAYLPSKTAETTADTFPGYYTLHILEDGETKGMLSVNAYTGQVFLHHWHGDFIEMSGEAHG